MADLGVDVNEATTPPTNLELQLGGSSFDGVPFPVAVGNRYIHLRTDGDETVCQVWRWDPDRREATREPDPGEQGGGVVLDRLTDGGLELTFSSGQAVLEGLASYGDLRVVFTQREILVERGGATLVTVRRARITGVEVGLRVDEDNIVMGASLPEGFEYQVDYVNRVVRLAQLVHSAEQPLIRNVRFSHCRIEGPAVIGAVGNVRLRRNGWNMLGAPPEALYVDLGHPQWFYGVVMLQNVVIEDSQIVNVALAQART